MIPSGAIDHTEGSFYWLHNHCPTVLRLLSIPYGLVVRSRTQLYEQGWLTQQRLPRPVISVGNLTVGGTGKTPVVMWLANWLCAKGKRVGILSRGYRRTTTVDCVLVSDGENVLANAREVGDEPFLMSQNCPGVVIAVGKDRYQLGRWVLKQLDIDCFILDDGYQHLHLYRDSNLLLIDAFDPQGLTALLPAGRLREPLSAARRATAIILTRVDQKSNHSKVIHTLESTIDKRYSPIHVQFHARTVINLRTHQIDAVDRIAGKRAIIFSGIGNAQSFRQTAEDSGVTILEELKFPDHYAYSVSDFQIIRDVAYEKNAEIILTTEKDGVKIFPFMKEEDNMWGIQLQTKIVKGEEALLQALPFLSL